MEQVQVAEAAERASGAEVLVDVREAHEWAAGHAPDAVHLPLSALTVDQLDQDAAYLVICRSGARSMQAAQGMREAGFTVTDVSGGMLAWEAAGLAMTADGDEDPRVIAP